MTLAGPGPKSLGDFRSFCLHEQRPAEARAMATAAGHFRAVRQAAGLSRRDLAAQLGVSVEAVVAIENGYGCLATVQPLLERAQRLTRP